MTITEQIFMKMTLRARRL